MPSKMRSKSTSQVAPTTSTTRSVNKRLIFKDQKDYSTFLSYLQFYLTPPSLRGQSSKVPPSHQLKNYAEEIELLAYCLMPNHFHLMLKQNSDHGISHFMSSVITKYVRYFNTRYKRIGPLFQGRYKAVRVIDEYQFTYLTKYIHRNPLDLPTFEDSPRRLSQYKYSNYGNYLQIFTQAWIHPDDVLVYFSKTNPRLSYQNFVEESAFDDIAIIAQLTLDAE